jgi:hypothetical protein
LEQLTKLVLWNFAGVTDKALPSIAAHKKLQVLILLADVSDAGLPPLTAITELMDPTLSGEQISDAGIEQIARLPKLARLSITHSAKITDRTLEILSKVSTLKGLDVRWSQQLSEEGMRKFQDARPDCKLIDR